MERHQRGSRIGFRALCSSSDGSGRPRTSDAGRDSNWLRQPFHAAQATGERAAVRPDPQTHGGGWSVTCPFEREALTAPAAVSGDNAVGRHTCAGIGSATAHTWPPSCQAGCRLSPRHATSLPASGRETSCPDAPNVAVSPVLPGYSPVRPHVGGVPCKAPAALQGLKSNPSPSHSLTPPLLPPISHRHTSVSRPSGRRA